MNVEKTCPSCEKRFPEHLITELEIGDDRGVRCEMRCSICALAYINELHGLPPGTPFRGPKAARAHAEAVEWLRTSGQGDAK